MKTQTRVKILHLIEKGSGKFGLLTYRNLFKYFSSSHSSPFKKSLPSKALLRPKDRLLLRTIPLAGIPDFEGVSRWVNARLAPAKAPNRWYAKRERFSPRGCPSSEKRGRKGEGLPQSLLPMVIATTGEIGNNSFDHNLGQWRDIPGCWFETTEATGRQLWICIADRGQGIYQSLVKVHPELANEQAALKAAFETIISGRSPEQRGNGLKFVEKNISTTPGGGIACISGTGHVFYGEQGTRCMTLLDKHFIKVKGTVTLMVWRLQ